MVGLPVLLRLFFDGDDPVVLLQSLEPAMLKSPRIDATGLVGVASGSEPGQRRFRPEGSTSDIGGDGSRRFRHGCSASEFLNGTIAGGESVDRFESQLMTLSDAASIIILSKRNSADGKLSQDLDTCGVQV